MIMLNHRIPLTALAVLALSMTVTGCKNSGSGGVSIVTQAPDSPVTTTNTSTSGGAASNPTAVDGSAFGNTDAAAATASAQLPESSAVAVNPTTASYLFYQSVAGLYAINPIAPTTPIAVVAGAVSGVQVVRSGTYDGKTQTLSDIHIHTLLYFKGGKLYKVNNAVIASSTPVPVQLSSESGATTVCDAIVAPDYVDPNNTQYAYELSVDTDCTTKGDNVWKMVRLGMTASDAPITAHPAVAFLRDYTTGAINGWLATDGGNLNRYDANFSNPVVVRSPASAVVNLNASSTYIVLKTDNQIQVYNPTKKTLSHVLHMSVAGADAVDSVVNDAGTFYFVDNNALYRAPLSIDDSVSAQAALKAIKMYAAATVTTATSTVTKALDRHAVFVQTSSIYFKEDVSTTPTTGTPTNVASLMPIAKAANADVATAPKVGLATVTFVDKAAKITFFAGGVGQLFYNGATTTDAAKPPTPLPGAGMVIEGEHKSLSPAAAWAGLTFSPTITYGAVTVRRAVRAVLQNCDHAPAPTPPATKPTTSVTGCPLESYNALSSAPITAGTATSTSGAVGLVPVSPAEFVFLSGDANVSLGYGTKVLLRSVDNTQKDVYYADLESKNSLAQITNTSAAGADETPLP